MCECQCAQYFVSALSGIVFALGLLAIGMIIRDWIAEIDFPFLEKWGDKIYTFFNKNNK